MHFRKLHHHKGVFPRSIAKLPISIKVASITMFVYCLAAGIANPFINIFFKDLFGTYGHVGFLNSIIYILPILWTIPLGKIIDKIPKASFLKFLFIAYLPLGFWLLSIKTISGAIIFRIYHSIIASLLWFSFIDYIRVHSPKRMTSESFGLFDTGLNLALVVGGIASGFLFMWLEYKIFIFMTIFFVLAFIAASFMPKFKHKKLKLKTIIGAFKKPFKEPLSRFWENKKIVHYSTLDFFVKGSFVMLLVLLGIYLKELNASYVTIGLVYGLSAIPLLSELFFSVIADHHKRKFMIKLGLFTGAIFFILMFFTKSITIIAILAILLSCSFSMIFPSLSGKITSAIHKKNVGKITGVTKSVGDLGGGLAPLAAGFIADAYGVKFIFLIGFAIFIFLFIYFMEITKRHEPKNI